MRKEKKLFCKKNSAVSMSENGLESRESGDLDSMSQGLFLENIHYTLTVLFIML